MLHVSANAAGGEQTLEKACKTAALEIWTFQTNEFKAKFTSQAISQPEAYMSMPVSANAAGGLTP